MSYYNNYYFTSRVSVIDKPKVALKVKEVITKIEKPFVITGHKEGILAICTNENINFRKSNEEVVLNKEIETIEILEGVIHDVTAIRCR